MKMLAQQIDPGAFVARYTFPVFNIVATGDEFTVPLLLPHV